ncbi:MAG: protein kinase, partial [Planctomycetota bacterium]|nr:protein kinase [Planctomycetota bacterium]
QEEESARVAETMIDGGKAASARTSFDAPPSRPPTPSSSQTSEDEDIPKSQALTASITTVRSKVEDALTMEGAIQGTPQYMPPEQAEGKIDEIDQRSDIYSLGAILYELLSLKRPVTGKTPHEILLKVIEHRITPPEKAAPKRGIPKELAAIAMKAMSGNKRRRYQTVSELQKDINLYLGGRSVSAKDDSAIEVIAKLVKRNKGLFAAVGVAATIVAVVVSIAFKRVGEKRDEAEAALQKAKTSAQAAANASAKQAQQAMAASRRFSLQAVEAAETGRMVEAERLLADAASVLAASPWLEYAHGKFDEHKTQYKLAAEHYKKSISIDDSIDESRRALKRLKTLESELAAARQVVANIDPQRNPQTLIHTADLFFGVGNWADSAKAYDAAANVLEQTIEAAPADKKPEFKKRVETARYKAGDARASLAVVGFRDEIKNRPVHEQRDIIERKLAQLSSVRPHHNLRFHYTDTSQQFIYAEIHHHDPLKYIHALAGFPIQELKLTYCGKVRSLRPLAGMPIKRLDLWGSGNIDLTTIPKLPLEYLSVRFNKTLNDLSVFKGMKLKYLDVGDTQVSDFSPLREMETLETLEMAHMWHITDISTLRGLKLKRLNFSQTHPKEMSVVKDMPLEELQFYMNGVADLSPIKGKKLRKLVTGHNVQDFSVIKGMPLEHLYVQGAGKFDISVIEGMPLTFLDCSRIKGVETLAPLAGMKLKELYVYETSVSNLKPLAGMPIERLFLESTKVTDLSALKGMPLRYLRLDSTEVTDLSPISGLPIRQLSIPKTKVSDLSPLVECLHLANLHLGGSSVTDLTPLESIRTLHTLTIPDTKVSSLEPLRGLGFSRLDITNAPITDLTPAAGSEHLREFTYAEGQEFNEASKALIEKWKANPRVNVQVVKPQQNQ